MNKASNKTINYNTAYAYYENTHNKIVNQLCSIGMKVPTMYDFNSKSWVIEIRNSKFVVFDTEASYSFDSIFNKSKKKMNRILSSDFVNSIKKCIERNSEFQYSEDGYLNYLQESQTASLIMSRIYLSSKEGCINFCKNTQEIPDKFVRVCLENIDSLDNNLKDFFVSNFHIPLCDEVLIKKQPIISKKKFKIFYETLDNIFWKYIKETDTSFLIHCSQGQSRSSLFCFCLIIKLLLHEKNTIFFELMDININDVSRYRLIEIVMEKIGSKRNLLNISNAFYTFILFFIDYECSKISF